MIALVGPSGAGKSTLLRAILDLHRPGVEGRGHVTIAEHRFDLGSPADRRALHRLRGGTIGWLPQAAAASLDPLRAVGRQLDEITRRHAGATSAEDALARVGLPARVAGLRPDAISGGMARRVALALALAGGPDLLLADEPLSGLDPVAADEILDLLLADAAERATLLVAHDLAPILARCDRIVVLQGGRLVDDRSPAQLATSPVPVTRGLVEAAQAAIARGATWWR